MEPKRDWTKRRRWNRNMRLTAILLKKARIFFKIVFVPDLSLLEKSLNAAGTRVTLYQPRVRWNSRMKLTRASTASRATAL
jgi:hypothetical protein